MAKGIIVPIAWLAMLIWSFVKVPAHSGLFEQHSSLEGSKLSWAWLSALNSAIGGWSPLAVNIPDFTRYAKSPRTAALTNVFALTVPVTLCVYVLIL